MGLWRASRSGVDDDPGPAGGVFGERVSHQRRDWDEIARLDPLWAILSDPAKRHGGWDMEEFLATGQREIGAVLESAKRWDLPVRRERALDFGCGVGRLTRAMSSEFAVATGVDISGEMISLALAINADVRACSFEILGDEGVTAHPDGYFDFIYSGSSSNTSRIDGPPKTP